MANSQQPGDSPQSDPSQGDASQSDERNSDAEDSGHASANRRIEQMEGAPYRGPDEELGGADHGITAHGVEGVADLRRTKEYAEMIVDTMREGLLVLDLDLRVEAANESFYHTFETGPGETIGRPIYELGNGQWDIPELNELLEEILPENKVVSGYEVTHDFEDIGERVMLLDARQLDEHERILLAIEDITERKQAEEELKELNKTLEERVKKRTEQVRALASRLTMAEQEERRQISHILHDDLQQQIFAAQVQLSSARRYAEGGKKEKLLGTIEQAEGQLQSAIETARHLSIDLSPPVLEEEGLADQLGWLASQMEDKHSLSVDVEAEHAFHVSNEDHRVILFRAVRELLFNVVKHTDVDRASVELSDEEGQMSIRVRDGGCGFDPDAVLGAEVDDDEAGFGLQSIRERLGLFGGRLELDSVPGEGTCATAYAPLEFYRAEDEVADGEAAAGEESSNGEPPGESDTVDSR